MEKIGVDRAREMAQKADLILYVVDSSVQMCIRDRVYITDEENKMSLYSHMFSIWFRSNRKIWRI